MERKLNFTRPQITEKEIELINRLIAENPSWTRTNLSRELCLIWNWCGLDGKVKDISCRTLLRRLDAKDIIKLPAARSCAYKAGIKPKIQYMLHDMTPVTGSLKGQLPLEIRIVREQCFQLEEYKSLIALHHYLGYHIPPGENIRYMVYSRDGRLLACLLFSASAWSCADRDFFIRWTASARKANLSYTTNNSRFLILPWVTVPHLASHILGLICRRIATDWHEKYGHPVYLLETYVEARRFRGTCYKASNWRYVGETMGRSRNDRHGKIQVPAKNVFVYPLFRNFREVLCNEPTP